MRFRVHRWSAPESYESTSMTELHVSLGPTWSAFSNDCGDCADVHESKASIVQENSHAGSELVARVGRRRSKGPLVRRGGDRLHSQVWRW